MRFCLRLYSKAKPIGADVISELVDRYAVFHPSPLSLERFINFGKSCIIIMVFSAVYTY